MYILHTIVSVLRLACCTKQERVEMCSVASLQVSINAMEILVMLCEKDAELIKRHITDSEFSEVSG